MEKSELKARDFFTTQQLGDRNFLIYFKISVYSTFFYSVYNNVGKRMIRLKLSIVNC